MEGYQIITEKLRHFTRKYYRNELLKGGILFFSLGCIYFFATLFIESFLWLQPLARTALFWIFILGEGYLLVQLILKPMLKLIGLQKGISFQESSRIIGNHFPEIQDKLLNILQLKENPNPSDLLLASIAQKAAEIQPIPFIKAVDFTKNKKYLKYAIVPLIIGIIAFFSGNTAALTQSFDRVVNHRKAFTPPAPFAFYIANDSLKGIQGKPFTVRVKTKGSVRPEEVKIVFQQQEYTLQKQDAATFVHTFSQVETPLTFYLTANGVQSLNYTLEVVKTPTILNVFMELTYPNYLGRKNETIQNTGNHILPEGTRVQWNVKAAATDTVSFITAEKRRFFTAISEADFVFKKQIVKPISYAITSSNSPLKDYEQLQFSLDVVKDEFPTFQVVTNIDSISRGTAQFAGQISDDYGIQKLQLVYYDKANSENKQSLDFTISKENIQSFYYQFPEGLNLQTGVNYELFFQVFDNDGFNGSKKTKSETFQYRQKTATELEEELLSEQKNTINNLEKNISENQNQQKEFEKIQQEIQRKKKGSWSDQKKVQSFIKRQQEYKKRIQRQTEKLQENLGEKKAQSEGLQEKKEALKKRVEELKKLEKQQKLLDEIAKIAQKLNKEDFLKKAKELAEQNKQQERSLERTLELVKRFYVEQKAMQIANQLEALSKEQEALAKKNDSTLVNQKEIKKAFDALQKELETLAKDNDKLKEPLGLPDTEDEKEAVKEALQKSEEKLSKKAPATAKKSQQKAAQKMKEMSAKMQQAMMEMEMDSMEENLDDLRKILENLVTFSFKQELLMNRFDEISTAHPGFGTSLKKQNELKTYFEHIDDSLYVLSMRLPKISTKIQDDLSTAHYNLAQTLDNFSENRFPDGVSNQRYVMTATNNLADYLSNILTNMKKSMSMKLGKGKGKRSGFSLPDIIKKQGALSEKMKEGMKSGSKPGEKKGKEGAKKPGEKGAPGKKGQKGKTGENGTKGNTGSSGSQNEDLDGALYQIFKEQQLLRQQLEDAIKDNEGNAPNGNLPAKKVLKTMKELENEVLAKGFNSQTLQKMQQLDYELLKLDKAALEQGRENKRKSTANRVQMQSNKKKELEFKKLFYNQTEILNRQSLPLQQNFKKKVREYFTEPKQKQ